MNLLPITPEIWAYSALIGEARRRSNDNKRNKNRDRGYQKNIHNDLIGTAGELLALKYFGCSMSEKSKSMFLHDLIKTEGGAVMKGVDVIFDNIPGNIKDLRLDIKTFDCEPNKRFFAINSKKHDKLKNNCEGYLCFLIPRLGRYAAVANYVNYSDVNSWEEKSLGSYGDPSKNINILSFQNSYFGNSNVSKDLKNKEPYKDEDIHILIKDGDFRSKFKLFAPNVSKILNFR